MRDCARPGAGAEEAGDETGADIGRKLIARNASVVEQNELRCREPSLAVGRGFHFRPTAAPSRDAHDFASANAGSAIHANRGLGHERAGTTHDGEPRPRDARLDLDRDEPNDERRRSKR